MIGAATGTIDLAEVLFVAFALFFAGLVYYLHREDKREGYPLEDEFPTVRHSIVGFPNVPMPKTYHLMDGTTSTLPKEYARRTLRAQQRRQHHGAALYPVGDPLTAGIGPGSYTLRSNRPLRTMDGTPQIQPLREATDYKNKDPDMEPRGRRVLGANMKEVGTCIDLWVDKGSKICRYLEVELDGGGGRRLVPIFYTVIRRNTSYFQVDAIEAHQFDRIPLLSEPTSITAREEDIINGFFAGGYIYSAPYKDALL